MLSQVFDGIIGSHRFLCYQIQQSARNSEKPLGRRDVISDGIRSFQNQASYILIPMQSSVNLGAIWVCTSIQGFVFVLLSFERQGNYIPQLAKMHAKRSIQMTGRHKPACAGVFRCILIRFIVELRIRPKTLNGVNIKFQLLQSDLLKVPSSDPKRRLK